MTDTKKAKGPLRAFEVQAQAGKTNYPPAFAGRVSGRSKRRLGDPFGLGNFGVNLTTLSPGSSSALPHAHSAQDEWIYVLEGVARLYLDGEAFDMGAGDCIGFPAGTGVAHCLVNESDADVVFIEVGDRTPGDAVTYPDDDLAATLGDDGRWVFTRRDGTRY